LNCECDKSFAARGQLPAVLQGTEDPDPARQNRQGTSTNRLLGPAALASPFPAAAVQIAGAADVDDSDGSLEEGRRLGPVDRPNSTTSAFDDHRLQRTSQGVKRLMMAFQDHRADRVGVGEFNFHWIDVPQDPVPATHSPCLAPGGSTTPIRGQPGSDPQAPSKQFASSVHRKAMKVVKAPNVSVAFSPSAMKSKSSKSPTPAVPASRGVSMSELE
jgi:hypothetical protein